MFNQEQIKELLKNKYVNKCSSKSITYNKDFKLRAIRKYYQEGFSPSMIFKEAGFNLNTIGRKKAGDCLVRWRRIYNKQGKRGLTQEQRGGKESGGGRPKEKFKNDKEEIVYLKTKVAYLKEENHFLKKIRELEKP